MNDSGFHVYDGSRLKSEWPDVDTSLLEEARTSVPAFPLEHLPPTWRQWVSDTAQSVGTPVDYVVQGLFAAVAALCGAGVQVRVTPAWTESLVLWLALVGSPSSGKSPALASVRAKLGDIEGLIREGDEDRRSRHAARLEEGRIAAERWRDECESATKAGRPAPQRPAEAGFDQPFVPSQIVVADATMEALADVVSGTPRGVILWRDELTAWLANLGRYSGGTDRAHWLEAWAATGITVNRRSRSQPLHLPKFPVSVVGSIQPDRLAEVFQGSDDGMAARFLYAWPELPEYTSLMDRRIARDDEALAMLQAIAFAAGTPEQPRTLAFDDRALSLFDNFLKLVHKQAADAGDTALEAGWLGKGRGTVARLAGVLTLLRWSENAAEDTPRTIDGDAVKAAAALWGDYFQHHAFTVFNQAGKTDRDRLARRVARWLLGAGINQVSRQDVRRDALAQSVDTAETDRTIERLVQAGILRLVEREPTTKAGRPPRRWDVHPTVSGVEVAVRKRPVNDFN